MAGGHASSGGTIYARALAEAVEAEGGAALLQDVESVLDSLCASWDADRILRSYFLATEVSGAQKRVAMDKLVEGRFPKLLGNFLKLLLERGRLAMLPEIGTGFREILDEKLGRVPVTITTAVPVPESEFRSWTEAIRAAVGGNAIVDHVVKPDIVAGAVIRVGDRVIDGSARRRLADLHNRIIQRGMQRHALQS
ncbi:MAG: ATP synthase F1 subunit delta [Planctomycetota bacterium]|nr:ATP synthase F1 subunit delta [Planctomycetota bacterium]